MISVIYLIVHHFLPLNSVHGPIKPVCKYSFKRPRCAECEISCHFYNPLPIIQLLTPLYSITGDVVPHS